MVCRALLRSPLPILTWDRNPSRGRGPETGNCHEHYRLNPNLYSAPSESRVAANAQIQGLSAAAPSAVQAVMDVNRRDQPGFVASSCGLAAVLVVRHCDRSMTAKETVQEQVLAVP